MTSPGVMTDQQKSTTAITSLFPDTIRFLAVDAAQKAGSGHPGAPMGMADMGFVLWDGFLKFDPKAPRWADRDRFVLSAGHSCLLLYSLLHLYGYDLPVQEVMNYRQWGSLTPGHPEFGHTPGVESTTGPLGQGVANAVGMALAERFLARRFNRPDFDLVNRCDASALRTQTIGTLGPRHAPTKHLTPLFNRSAFLSIVLEQQRFFSDRQPAANDVREFGPPNPRDSGVDVGSEPSRVRPVVRNAIRNRREEEPDLVAVTPEGFENEVQPHDLQEKGRFDGIFGLSIDTLNHLHEGNESLVALFVLRGD